VKVERSFLGKRWQIIKEKMMFQKAYKKMHGAGLAVFWAFMALAILGLITSEADAGIYFNDDFEDGDTVGWLTTNTGSGGSFGVEIIDGNKWAYIYNSKSGKASSSMEFDYDPVQVLAFDLQMIANTGRGNHGETMHAASGVTVSFESQFNLTLGAVSFCNATSSSMLPSNGYQIGSTPNAFEASFSEWADQANVGLDKEIASLKIEFWAIGHTAQIPAGSAATARVRFDDVLVVPEPATISLFALGGLALLRKRK